MYDKYLYAEDLGDVIALAETASDSSIRIRNYVNLWIEEQTWLYRAELNLSKEQKDVSMQLEDLRWKLLVGKYKELFLQQKLDTGLTHDEILNFYNENPQNFILNSNAVKAILIKIETTAADIDQIKYLYKSSRVSDLNELTILCSEQAEIYIDQSDKWGYLNDFFKEIPMKGTDQISFLRTRSYIEVEEEGYLYLLSIKDYIVSGKTSPLELAIDQIKTILMNKRRTLTLDELQHNIYEDAMISNEIEYFFDKEN